VALENQITSILNDNEAPAWRMTETVGIRFVSLALRRNSLVSFSAYDLSFRWGISLSTVQFCSIALVAKWYGFGAIASGHATCASTIVR